MTTAATGPELERFRAQYFALVPAYLLRLPSSAALAQPESQRYLVDRLLEDDRYPAPCPAYRKAFWRYLVGRLERGVNECNAQSGLSDEVEVDERIYEAVAKLMMEPNAEGGDAWAAHVPWEDVADTQWDLTPDFHLPEAELGRSSWSEAGRRSTCIIAGRPGGHSSRHDRSTDMDGSVGRQR